MTDKTGRNWVILAVAAVGIGAAGFVLGTRGGDDGNDEQRRAEIAAIVDERLAAMAPVATEPDATEPVAAAPWAIWKGCWKRTRTSGWC